MRTDEQPYNATANWATDRTAELYLPLDGPKDATLRLAIAPLSYPGAPAQKLSIAINDVPVLRDHALAPGWQTVEAKLPAAATRRGPNRVRLEFAQAASPRTVFPDAASRAVIGGTGVVSPVNLEAHGFSEAYISAFGPDGNEVKASTNRRGYNVAVFDQRTGKLLETRGFDTAANSYEADALAAYLSSIPRGRIVALATKGDATAHLTPAAITALRGSGLTRGISCRPGGTIPRAGRRPGRCAGHCGRGDQARRRLRARGGRFPHAGRGAGLGGAGAVTLPEQGSGGVGERRSRRTDSLPLSHSPALRLVDYLLALASAMFAAALYLRTLAPGVLGGDSGEFQFAAWLGGFAHPTGYPLYLLLGYLWTHLLPIADAAWRMNAFSALWGAVAVGLLYLLALRMLQMTAPAGWPIAISRLLALLAAAIFAVTPTFWSQAVVAEVYALNAALIIAILLALVTWAARGRMSALYLAAFLFGLSLAHHRTTLLWIPAIAVFVWLTHQQHAQNHSFAHSPIRPFFLSLLVLAPLLLYLTIPLTAPRTPYVHVQVGPNQTLDLYKPTLDGFLNYVTGREFESEFRAPAGALGRVVPSLRLLAGEVTWIGVLLGVIGLIWLARRSRPLLALTGLGFLTLFVFNLFYGIGDIAVYYIPLYALWALWIALRRSRDHRGHRKQPSYIAPREPISQSPTLPLPLSTCFLVSSPSSSRSTCC